MKKLIQYLITLFVFVAPAQMFGQLAVAIAADPWAEIRWLSGELPQWIQTIKLAQQQISNSKEMIDLVGHPEKIADSVINKVSTVMPETLNADAMKTVQDTIILAESSFALHKSATSLAKGDFDVPADFTVLGKTFTRDRSRYLQMAKENALHYRVNKAAEDKRAVDRKEMDFQQQTLLDLRTAKTQTEIELHQASLMASKQRMDLAGERVRQAETEMASYRGQQELEEHNKQEQAVETAETMRGELDRRADDAISVGGGPISGLPVNFAF